MRSLVFTVLNSLYLRIRERMPVAVSLGLMWRGGLGFLLLNLPEINRLLVVIYKAALISLAAVLGYWLDRAPFPYSRPNGYASPFTTGCCVAGIG